MGADDLLENGKFVAVIENHSNLLGNDPYTNSYSTARNSYYNISGLPTAVFDGVLKVVGGNHSQSMYPSYLPKYNTRIAKASDVSMSMVVTNDGLNYTAVITLVKTPEWAATNPVLQFNVTQSNISYNWQGQSHLEHVNRLMVPDQNGTPVDFGSGDTQVITLNFTLDLSGWTADLEDIEFITFVQDNTGKEIHQCIKRGAIDLSVDFSASATQINKGESVTFTSEVSGGYIGTPQVYEWFTPGGVPVYSQDTNVTVTYNTCGPHDVTLVVNRGGQIDTVARTHYIQVGPVVGITSNPGDSACWYTPITLDATTATATEYLWSPGGETTPSITITGGEYGVGTHSFSVTVTSADGCVQTVNHDIYYDGCVGLGEPVKGISALIYPNPNNGRFTVELNSGKSITTDLTILNLLGSVVYQEKGVNIDGKMTRSLNLNLANGLYYLVLQNSEGKSVQKFSVTR